MAQGQERRSLSILFRFWLVVSFFVGVGPAAVLASGPPVIPQEDHGGGATWPAEMINERVATRLFDDVFTKKLPDVCSTLMIAGARNHTPVGVYQGPTGFERFVAFAWREFPSATFAIAESYADGDLVTLRWTMHSLYGDEIDGFRSVRLDGLAILRFENHMIAESWIQYDRQSLSDQVALEIPPKDGSEPRPCPPCQTP